MRLVATSDTHYKVDVSLIPDGDIFVHAGDLMSTGYPEDWKNQLEWLAKLPHKTKIYVPGNHDFHIYNYPGPALQEMRKIGVTVIGLPNNPNYQSYKLENGMSLLGLPYVTDLPRWAFNSTEEDLEGYLQYVGDHEIVVSHCPPKYMRDKIVDFYGTEYCGIQAYANYARKNCRLKHWICGHIHEGYGSEYFSGLGAHVHNVAMCDREYKQVNKPLVLDL